MAIAKATSEALAQLSNTLLRSAEEISSAKAEMDRLLNSIPWDDPVGINFRNSYDEDFRPLTEKLIPAIDDYVTYLENQNLIVMEYDTITMDSGVVTGISAAAISAGAALAGARYVVDCRPISERKGLTDFARDARKQHQKELAAKEREDYLHKKRDVDRKTQEDRKKQEEEKKRRAEVGKQVLICLNPNGKFEWRGSNENLTKGKKEDKKLYDNAKAAMNGIDFNKGVSVAQLRQVADAVLGSENSEITWSRRSLGPYLEGSHDAGTRLAILNKDLEGEMSVCDRMSIFAHEAAHVIQDDLYNDFKEKSLKGQATTDQIDFINEYENYPKNVTDANFNTYHNNIMEIEARYYENIVGQACTDYYNEQLKLKQQFTQK